MKLINIVYSGLWFVIIMLPMKSLAQDNTQTSQVEDHLLKANLFFFPSVVYERAIKGDFVAKAEVGLSLTVFDNFGDTSVGIFPKIEGQLKYYYNLKRRSENDKSIAHNSGSFVAGAYQFQDKNAIFNEENRTSNFSHLGGLWGFQKTYTSGLSLLVEVGFGYDFGYVSNTSPNGRPFPLIGFELGWVLF